MEDTLTPDSLSVSIGMVKLTIKLSKRLKPLSINELVSLEIGWRGRICLRSYRSRQRERGLAVS